MRQLSLYTVPAPGPATGEMLGRAAAAERFRDRLRRVRGTAPAGMALTVVSALRAQISILHPAFWLASLLIAGLGFALPVSGTATGWGLDAPELVFVLSAPLAVAASVFLSYQDLDRPVTEVELATTLGPADMALARTVIVLAYNLLLYTVLSATAAATGLASFAGLTPAWLAPLLASAGLALYLSLARGPLTGAAGALTGWGLLLWLQLSPPGGAPVPAGWCRLATSLIGIGLILLAHRHAARMTEAGCEQPR